MAVPRREVESPIAELDRKRRYRRRSKEAEARTAHQLRRAGSLSLIIVSRGGALAGRKPEDAKTSS